LGRADARLQALAAQIAELEAQQQAALTLAAPASAVR
jgi:BMFP domain-containing protein YqiC